MTLSNLLPPNLLVKPIFTSTVLKEPTEEEKLGDYIENFMEVMVYPIDRQSLQSLFTSIEDRVYKIDSPNFLDLIQKIADIGRRYMFRLN